MKTQLYAFALCALICIVPEATRSQESASETKIGLSASLQDAQLDLMVPIRMTTFSIAPAVGFVWAQDGASDLRVGLVPRFFLSTDEVAPFIGGRIAVMLYNPKVGESTTDFLFGLAGGGEYFINPRFTLGVEAQLNLTFSDKNSGRFGNPGKTNLNTATAIFATIYF